MTRSLLPVPFWSCGESALRNTALAFAFAVVVGGCSSPYGGSSSLPHQAGHSRTPIQHVIFIIQENRSFNNLFMGFPGATTQNFGYDTKGRRIALQPVGLATAWDISHSSQAFFAACDSRGTLPGTDCRMDGWNKETVFLQHPPNAAYAYVPRKQVAPYWNLAQRYVLADRMFSSNLDASFVSHQYAVAAYASRSVDGPETYWGCEGGRSDTVRQLTERRGYGGFIAACFENPTIAGEADNAGLSWRFYAGAVNDNGGLWSAYQADRAVFYGTDWNADVISPSVKFLSDIARGRLANITWITPTWENSDHPGLWSSGGPAWVTSLVDAIGMSKFWDSTAVFIIWDDWGGWFDPVQPIYEDYDGLGFRVPLLIVSPYAKHGYVTHVQYETSSVLRFIEDNFGLPQLAQSDARANNPAADAFDYSQQPRKFERIGGNKPLSYWMTLQRRSPKCNVKSIIAGD